MFKLIQYAYNAMRTQIKVGLVHEFGAHYALAIRTVDNCTVQLRRSMTALYIVARAAHLFNYEDFTHARLK